MKVSAYYLEKQKSFIPEKQKFKPLIISKQKRFVYRADPIFSEGFDAMLGEMHYSSWWFLCVEQVEDLTPEKYASAFSQMIFAWVDPLMRAGWKKQLYPADLWSLQVNFSQSDFSKVEKIFRR